MRAFASSGSAAASMRSPMRRAPNRLTSVLMVASATSFRGVDNLLAASSVSDRLAAGAVPLRIEADFVTCSQ